MRGFDSLSAHYGVHLSGVEYWRAGLSRRSRLRCGVGWPIWPSRPSDYVLLSMSHFAQLLRVIWIGIGLL